MVNTVWLTSTSADFNIMREACLSMSLAGTREGCGSQLNEFEATYPHGSMERTSNLIVLLKSRTAA